MDDLEEHLDNSSNPNSCRLCCNGFCTKLKAFISFTISHLGLIALMCGYCVLGGLIFEKLERDNEIMVRTSWPKRIRSLKESGICLQVKKSIEVRREKLMDDIWSMTEKSLVLQEQEWIGGVEERLYGFELELVHAMKSVSEAIHSQNLIFHGGFCHWIIQERRLERLWIGRKCSVDVSRIALLLHCESHNHRVWRPDPENHTRKDHNRHVRDPRDAIVASMPWQHWQSHGQKLQVWRNSFNPTHLSSITLLVRRFIYWRLCCYVCVNSQVQQRMVSSSRQRTTVPLARGRRSLSYHHPHTRGPPLRSMSVRSQVSRCLSAWIPRSQWSLVTVDQLRAEGQVHGDWFPMGLRFSQQLTDHELRVIILLVV